jgi:hypothetical protein
MIKSRRMRWAGHIARVLIEEKRPLEKRRRRWVDNFKIDLTEVAWNGMAWIDVALDRE